MAVLGSWKECEWLKGHAVNEGHQELCALLNMQFLMWFLPEDIDPWGGVDLFLRSWARVVRPVP
jgi:hypothetical protein